MLFFGSLTSEDVQLMTYHADAEGFAWLNLFASDFDARVGRKSRIKYQKIVHGYETMFADSSQRVDPFIIFKDAMVLSL